jgi:hypothetical protein
VLTDAVPPLSAAVPITVAPSRNCTLPVAAAGVTVALKVTVCPATDGFKEEPSVVLAAAFDTDTVTGEEVLTSVPGSPPYTAVIECIPTARFAAVSDAVPLLSADVPSTVAPSRNCTEPVADAGANEAVSETL